jgi:hypothetical protein
MTFAPELFQTVFAAVVFQLPFPAVMAAPSPPTKSQVNAAARDSVDSRLAKIEKKRDADF